MNKRSLLIAGLVLCVITGVTFFLYPAFSFSAECKPGYTYSNESELKDIISSCEQKTQGLRQQITSLSSQIQYMDTQIYLTELKIQDTEAKITKTQSEIETLSTRIEGLDTSLNYLSKQMLQRVAESYKQGSVSLFTLILDTSNAGDLLNRIKYMKTAQENNQKLLMQVQETKINFEDQKKMREEKKVQLAELNNTLNSQKSSLDVQKAQKQTILSDTKNDETLYQSLLGQAQRQMLAFKTFVQSSGADTIIGPDGLGKGSDGSYYSQRDSRWAYKAIGYSNENVLNVGCLLTSVAMVLKKNNIDVTPLDIAANPSYFYLSSAYMRLRNQFNPWQNGLMNSQISVSSIDEELQNNHYVIVGIAYSGCNNSGGDHFVVLTKKDGNDYIMHDPIYGPDLKFSSHYSTICSAETFK